jgi:hypothetical protein
MHAAAETVSALRAAARTGVFLFKVLPMIPSRAINLGTPTPVVEKLEYQTSAGPALGDVYRPSTNGQPLTGELFARLEGATHRHLTRSR